MNNQNPKEISTARKIAYKVMLYAMLHSTFIAPAHGILYAYFNKSEGLHYEGSRMRAINYDLQSKRSENVKSILYEKLPDHTHFNTNSTKVILPPNAKISMENEDSVILSDMEVGVIGISKENPIDKPSDNLFKLDIQSLPAKDDKVFLQYELYGLQDHNAVSRSINDRTAIGGYIIKKQEGWSQQSEEISADWLVKGENRILFTTPSGANYQYKIKNLRIQISKKINQNVSSKLVVANRITFVKDNKVYIKGFIKGSTRGKVLVDAEGTVLKIKANEFEGIITLSETVIKRKFLVLRAMDESGLIGQELIDLDQLLEADRLFKIETDQREVSASFKALTNQKLSIEGASIFVNDSALSMDKEISIRHLRKVDIPPMEAGIINVTKGGKAFRFLPDGTKFEKPVKISVEYDTLLLPPGIDPKEIKTYFFDTKAKKWTAVKTDSIDKKNRTVISYTTHFTDYINGVIQAPNNPEAAGFTSTMMNDIKAADPTAEMTIISPPEVSQTGETSVSYPIKIPSGRHGMQPHLALQYSNDGGNGWLGLGWNLSIPSITLDTRWGVPEFNQINESEIYTLGGEQLMYPQLSGKDWMPNRHQDNMKIENRARIDNAVFSFRKQGSFTKIERLGADSKTYYWKVTDTDGNLNWYGGKTSSEDNYIIKDSDGNIVHWALYMTEDLYGNNIKYSYTNDIIATQTGINENLNGGRIFNLERISYTGKDDLDGNYSVEFNNETDIRNDISIYAKLGVKQITPYRLARIDVKYKKPGESISEIIRSYVLNYKSGEFNKSLLDKISEKYGNDINNQAEFYSHTFDYYNDVRSTPESPIVLFGNEQTISLPQIKPDFLLGFGNLVGNSKINSNQTTETGWEVRPAVGLELSDLKTLSYTNDPSSSFTVGTPFGQSYTTSKGKVSLVDIDGNGADDFVFKKGSGVKYIPHFINHLGESTYGDEKDIVGISELSKSEGTTSTVFGESYDFKFDAFHAGTKRFKSNTNTSLYFTDGNGDGLMDLVKDNIVLFNHIDPNTENPTFTNSSEHTPNALISSGITDIIQPTNPEPDLINPEGYDTVRVWIAPKDGQIQINDYIRIFTTNPASVYYSIETSKNSINGGNPFRIYLTSLNSLKAEDSLSISRYNGNNPALGCSNCNIPIDVVKGQKIYFRLHHKVGAMKKNEALSSNPIITYTNYTELLDENGIDRKHTSYTGSFILSKEQDLIVPNYSGNYQINWYPFTISKPSDQISYYIMREYRDIKTGKLMSDPVKIFEKICPKGVITTVNSTLISDIISLSDVDKKEVRYKFYVTSKTNVNWIESKWEPTFVFTPDDTNNPILTKFPIVNYSIFKTNFQRKLILAPNWPAQDLDYDNSDFGVKPNIAGITLPSNVSGSFSLYVKKDNQVLDSSVTVYIKNGIISLSQNFSVNFFKGNIVSKDYVPINYAVGYYVTNSNDEAAFRAFYSATSGNTVLLTAHHRNLFGIIYTSPITVDSQFNSYQHLGPLNMGWGQFFYNAELDSTNLPGDSVGKLINNQIIDNPYPAIEDSLIITLTGDCKNLSNENAIKDCLQAKLNSLSNLNIPNKDVKINSENVESVVMAIQNKVKVNGSVGTFLAASPLISYSEDQRLSEKWIGLYDTQFSSPYQMRTSDFRGSLYDFIFREPEEGNTEMPNDNYGMRAINMSHHTSSRTFSAGWGLDYNKNVQGAYNCDTSGFVDLNGDSYPDILNTQQVQLTSMTGGQRSAIGHNYSESTTNSSNGEAITTTGGGMTGARASMNSITASLSTLANLKGSARQSIVNTALAAFLGIPLSANKGKSSTDIGPGDILKGIGLNANLSGTNTEDSHWMDLNGDGLPEKIIFDPAEGLKFELNTGKLKKQPESQEPIVWEKFQNLDRYFSKPNALSANYSFANPIRKILAGMKFSNSLPSIDVGMSASGSGTEGLFQDINGDGLIDYYSYSDDEHANIYINQGNSFYLPEQRTELGFSLKRDNSSSNVFLSGNISLFGGVSICCSVPPFFYFPILFLKGGGTVSGSGNLSVSNTDKAFKDYNRDGFVDYIEKSDLLQNGDLKVRYSRIARTNMLKTVNNPIGGGFVVDYQCNPVTYDNPNPKWVMKSTTVFTGNGDKAENYSKKFRYLNARYDRRERLFYGFEKVMTETVKDLEDSSPLRTEVTTYHNQSYFLNGILKESYVVKGAANSTGTDVANLFSKTINTHKVFGLSSSTGKINTGMELPDDFDTGGTNGRHTAAVQLTRTENHMYELGDTPMKTVTEFEYDGYGNITKYKYLGNESITEDNYTSEITYHIVSNTNYNLLRIPSSIVVRDHAGNEKRKRTTVLHSETEKYAVKEVTQWNGQKEKLTTLMEYDVYGNTTKIITPTTFYNYITDTDEHKYVEKIQEPFDTDDNLFEATAKYDPKFDKIIEKVDISGNKMIYEYDSFGRLIMVRSPKEVLASAPYTIKFEYFPKLTDVVSTDCIKDNDFKPFALTSHFDVHHKTNDIRTITFMDGLGRAIQVKKDIEMGGQEKMSISGKVVYDEYGRVIVQHHPSFEELSCTNYILNTSNVSSNYSTTEYDELDRPILAIDPEETETSISYIVTDGQLKTITKTMNIDNIEIVSETYKDVSGRIVKSNTKGDSDIYTYFHYNSIGELMKYTDASNLSTLYSYDNLGRKVSVTHPDSGITNFGFNEKGQLYSVQTANMIPTGVAIFHSYSRNRLTDILYPDDDNDNISNVHYEYGDQNGTSENNTEGNLNGRGRLVFLSDATGTQKNTYGNMGEMIQNIRKVQSPNPTMPVREFKTSYTYDSWNRLLNMIYPDGETVNYAYDLGGNLFNIVGDHEYVQHIEYDVFEQKTALQYGNNTSATYKYSAARRLTEMQTNSAKGPLLSLIYEYDKVGNVTSLLNTKGNTFSHFYKYDNLNRLIQAQGNYQNSEDGLSGDHYSEYRLDMEYNNTHQIIDKSQYHLRKAVSGNSESHSNNFYEYNEGNHRLAKLNNSLTQENGSFSYDNNGNMTSKVIGAEQQDLFWDESNRLRVVNNVNTGTMQHYIYDASGERIIKSSSFMTDVYNNGKLYDSNVYFDSYTTYPSGFLTIDQYGQYTKHYYAGSQRIASWQVDGNYGLFDIYSPTSPKNKPSKKDFDYEKLRKKQEKDLQKYLKKANKGQVKFKEYKSYQILKDENAQDQTSPSSKVPPTNGPKLYYFHPDHLGSSTYLTDVNGDPYQFFLNLPFGETMAERKNVNEDFETPYKFNGKELDTETGFYYYGARYYDPKLSIWMSVDPLAEQFPNASPYNYCFNNPVNLIDPTGMAPDDWVERKDGSIYWDNNATSQGTTKAGETWRGKDYIRYKVWNNDRAKGLVQEHYASDKSLHYEQHDGKYQLGFSGSVVTDNQITGKELNNAKNADFGIEGKMYLNAVFSNGGTYTASTYDFTSGPYGNGPTPNKNYTAYKYADSNESGMRIYGDPGFKLYLEDFNGRDGLRVHPDTNGRGTMGCIGINGSAGQLKSLGNFFKGYFNRFNSMNVNFQIPNNPNYGNSGKANPHLGQ